MGTGLSMGFPLRKDRKTAPPAWSQEVCVRVWGHAGSHGLGDMFVCTLGMRVQVCTYVCVYMELEAAHRAGLAVSCSGLKTHPSTCGARGQVRRSGSQRAVWSGKFTTVSEPARPSLCAPMALPVLTLNPSRLPHFTACSSPGINSSRELSTSYSLMQMAEELPPRPRSFHALPGHTCPGGHRGPLWLRPRCPDGHPATPVFRLRDPCQPALVASAARLLPCSLKESSGVLPRPFPRGPVETLTLAPIFLMLPVPDGTLRIRDAHYWAPRLDARWPGQSTPTSTQGRQARPPLASQLVVGAVREGWGAQVPGSPGSS